MSVFNFKHWGRWRRTFTAGEAPHWFWRLSGLAALGVCSATGGVYLGLISQSTPLLQQQLTPEQAAVFGSDALASSALLGLPQLERPVNILVIGTKVLSSEVANPPPQQGYQALVNSFEGLADTLLLLRFDPSNQRLTVLSIPRDTLTWIPGRGEAKINEANALGGPALTAKTVNELLAGVPIDRYVRVNVQGIEKLVDALGGVTVYVPKPMRYQDDSQHLYINLQAGPQHLNGEQALNFLRFRYDELGDIGRVQRQQALLRALVEQSFTPDILRRLSEVTSVLKAHIDTNLSLDELIGLAGFISQVKRSQMKLLMLPGGFNGPGIDAPSYWLPDRDRLQALVAEYFDQPSSGIATAQPSLDLEQVRVAIQDSQQQPIQVQALIANLSRQGYGQVEEYEPWSEPLSLTRIIAQQGDVALANRLQQQLGFGEVRVESTGILGSDITIQLGTDSQKWLTPAAKVQLDPPQTTPPAL